MQHSGKRRYLFYGVSIFIALLFLGRVVIYAASDAESATYLEGVGSIETLGSVQYVEVNSPAPNGIPKQLLLFVHGTPGSLTGFRNYLRDPLLRERFHMIAVTRPGWINARDDKVPDLAMQAEALRPLLERNRSEKGAIVMGHSYGGPVITRVAMDYPELVGGLVYVATTGNPKLSGPRWYNRFAVVLPRFILGAPLKGANAEIWGLRPQLEEMLPRWADIEVDAIIVQGGRDTLVNPGNADFIAAALKNSNVTLIYREEEGHFILWERDEMIREAILAKFPG